MPVWKNAFYSAHQKECLLQCPSERMSFTLPLKRTTFPMFERTTFPMLFERITLPDVLLENGCIRILKIVYLLFCVLAINNTLTKIQNFCQTHCTIMCHLYFSVPLWNHPLYYPQPISPLAQKKYFQTSRCKNTL